MPRQEVPYPTGAICRLRERIGELFDLLGQKLHSINGVEGDGQGNVTIKSGDAAVVINNDQAQHEIEIALDSSQLPAAAVSSVNGQTGAVALTADDIPSDNGDVQTDIDNLEAADTTLQGNINAEALARQNADSTLQTNINTVTASLPAAAAAAVATDPTVAQLVTDMAGKVDLTDVSTVETPDTIAKRNGSGRLVAADPASGATDKTLTNANWISQTGDSGPNNLIHRSGNESKNGNLKLLKPLFISRTDNGACYIQINDLGFDCATIPNSTITRQTYEAYDKDNHRMLTYYIGRRTNGSNLLNITIRNFDGNGNQIGQGALILSSYADGTVDLRLQDGLGHDIQVGHT